MLRLVCKLLLGLGLVFAQPQLALAQAGGWPKAVQLMNSGQTQAALPVLEQLVSANPDNKAYRFELAVALFRMGRDGRAKWHLEQVRGADLTAKEGALVGQVLSQIAARSVWSGSFGIALKPESNANRKTSISSLTLGGLDFELNPNSRAKPGVSVVVTGGLGYSPRLSENLKANFAVFSNLRYNKDPDLQDYQTVLRGGLQYFPNQRSSLSAGVQQGFRFIAEQPYSQSRGIWAEYARLLGTRGRLEFGVDLSQTSHKVALPDSRRALLTARYSHALSGKAQLTFAGFLEDTRGTLPNLAGKRGSLSISGIYSWDGGLMTSVRVGQQYEKRRGPEPLFGVTREDRNTSLEISIYHRDFRIKSFAPTLVLGIESNRSNVPLARYENRYISIGLTRSF